MQACKCQHREKEIARKGKKKKMLLKSEMRVKNACMTFTCCRCRCRCHSYYLWEQPVERRHPLREKQNKREIDHMQNGLLADCLFLAATVNVSSVEFSWLDLTDVIEPSPNEHNEATATSVVQSHSSFIQWNTVRLQFWVLGLGFGLRFPLSFISRLTDTKDALCIGNFFNAVDSSHPAILELKS